MYPVTLQSISSLEKDGIKMSFFWHYNKIVTVQSDLFNITILKYVIRLRMDGCTNNTATNHAKGIIFALIFIEIIHK